MPEVLNYWLERFPLRIIIDRSVPFSKSPNTEMTHFRSDLLSNWPFFEVSQYGSDAFSKCLIIGVTNFKCLIFEMALFRTDSLSNWPFFEVFNMVVTHFRSVSLPKWQILSVSLSKWLFFEVTYYRIDLFFEVSHYGGDAFSKCLIIEVTNLKSVSLSKHPFSKWLIIKKAYFRSY